MAEKTLNEKSKLENYKPYEMHGVSAYGNGKKLKGF